jgi:hypothetical protein
MRVESRRLRIEMKNLLIEPVDYDKHPRFATETESWKVDESLVATFTAAYAELLSTGDSGEVDLVDMARSIFEAIAEQGRTNEEQQFVYELSNDVVTMVADHVKFYGGLVPFQPAPESRSELQNLLIRDGHYVTSISQPTLLKINRKSKGAVEVLRRNASEGKRSREDLSINSGPLIRSIVRALNRDFRKNGVLTSLTVLQRGHVQVVGAALELSVPESTWWKLPADANDWPATLYAHVDRSVEAPKSIVYLTDVTAENGPTTCYPGIYENLDISGVQDLVGRCLETVGSSTQSLLHEYYKLQGQPLLNERFRSHFMKLPKSVRFNSHFGWDVMKNSELEDMMMSRQREVLGPAGTALVFDGSRLLHRGGQIESGERIVLQVVFERTSIFKKFSRVVRSVVNKLKST